MSSDGKTSRIVWFKEIITAALALTIMGAIMVFLSPSLLASPVDATSAQAIFAVLGGWGGVVIGYYFGRIPAEKAADKAEKVADAARSEKDRAEKEKVNEIVTSNEKLADYEAKFKELLKQLEATEEIIKKSDEE
jgi:hypothetical protein